MTPSAERRRVELHVNGAVRTAEVEARATLAEVLRDELRLTGTHVGCEHGVCGSCTVLVDGRAVRSCLVFAVQLDATPARIVTVEGLGTPDALHPVQQAFHDALSFQCGFCTPGFVLMTRQLLDAHPQPSDDEIRHYLAGNLCRCAAYPEIIKAVRLAAAKRKG